MTRTAFVLTETASGKAKEIANLIKHVDGIKAVHVITEVIRSDCFNRSREFTRNTRHSVQDSRDLWRCQMHGVFRA